MIVKFWNAIREHVIAAFIGTFVVGALAYSVYTANSNSYAIKAADEKITHDNNQLKNMLSKIETARANNSRKIEKDIEVVKENLAILMKSQNLLDDATLRDLISKAAESSSGGQQAMAITRYLEGNAARYYRALATAQLSSGEHEKSLASAERWAQLEPNNPSALIVLGQLYMGKGDLAQAEDAYRKILQRDNGNVVALNNLAWLLKDSKPEEALSFATKAAKYAPENHTIIDTYAQILLQVGETERAINYLGKLVKDSPTPLFKYHLAVGLVQAGRNDEAKTFLASIIEDPKSPETLTNNAITLLRGFDR